MRKQLWEKEKMTWLNGCGFRKNISHLLPSPEQRISLIYPSFNHLPHRILFSLSPQFSFPLLHFSSWISVGRGQGTGEQASDCPAAISWVRQPSERREQRALRRTCGGAPSVSSRGGAHGKRRARGEAASGNGEECYGGALFFSFAIGTPNSCLRFVS